MKDQGINKGLVQSFDTSSINTQNVFFGFRKMFRDNLNKLNVKFYDSCCPDASKAMHSSYRAITAATVIVPTDGTIHITAGTFVQPLPIATSINAGQKFTIVNSGTGTITIDPAGTQTINGVLTLTLAAGEKVSIQSTGTNYITI